MKEATLRKWHRSAGIVFVLFIIIQTLTGILLSIEDLLGTYWGGHLQIIHYRFRPAGDFYRIGLGLGLLWLAGTGSIIWIKIRQRMKKARK